jgi:hypothetical protein
MKTVERAHTPKNLWQKIRLKKNYMQALEQARPRRDGPQRKRSARGRAAGCSWRPLQSAARGL